MSPRITMRSEPVEGTAAYRSFIQGSFIGKHRGSPPVRSSPKSRADFQRFCLSRRNLDKERARSIRAAEFHHHKALPVGRRRREAKPLHSIPQEFHNFALEVTGFPFLRFLVFKQDPFERPQNDRAVASADWRELPCQIRAANRGDGRFVGFHIFAGNQYDAVAFR